MANLFKDKVKEQLIVAAHEFFKLLGKNITISSDDFEFQKDYLLKFNKTNFLYLTGVVSHIKWDLFFKKCFDGTILADDFDYDEIKNKTNIRNKLKHLVNISKMFDKELLAQEQFVRNKVVCKVATADNECTIGFADGHYCVYPKTILNKNRLDETKLIIKIKPIIKWAFAYELNNLPRYKLNLNMLLGYQTICFRK